MSETVTYEQAPYKPPPRRGVLVFLGEDVLVRLLHLPPGWSITGVHDDFERNGILLRLTGPGAPEYAEGRIPWEVHPPHLVYLGPSDEALEADPNAAGTLAVALPDWEGDHPPGSR
jgi:hypothetical protein